MHLNSNERNILIHIMDSTTFNGKDVLTLANIKKKLLWGDTKEIDEEGEIIKENGNN